MNGLYLNLFTLINYDTNKKVKQKHMKMESTNITESTLCINNINKI